MNDMKDIVYHTPVEIEALEIERLANDKLGSWMTHCFYSYVFKRMLSRFTPKDVADMIEEFHFLKQLQKDYSQGKDSSPLPNSIGELGSPCEAKGGK